MLTIVSTIPLSEQDRARIRAAAPDFTLVEVPRGDQAQRLAVAPTADIWYGGGVDPSVLRAARRLQWIQLATAGVDRYLYPELQAAPVRITNVRGLHKDTIAEHVILMMLALARRLPEFFQQQAAARWHKLELSEIAGDTVGIVGLGSIGQEVARRARAFRLRVIGTRFSGAPVDVADQTFGPDGLEQVLRQARWVVLACPLTERTHRMIGAEQLDWIGPNGYLINIGRGELIDEPALISALQEGRIAGAGLDVFATEPLPAESPLWRLPNVVITPHVAGSLRDYIGRATEVFCENLRRFRAGQPLHNEVDKLRGY
ncbi:MAG TPA: D-2-hydroxyacid dehydrogenase [Bacillota bacterium]